MLEHIYGSWQVVTAPTCTQKGKEKRTCTVCGHIEERNIPALGHHWEDEFTTDTPATCTEQGSKSKHCSHEDCTEKTEVTVIPMLEHTYGEWEVVTAPTCTEKGKERRTCSACGHIEERDIPALDHDWEEEFTIDNPATCTSEGSKSKHCSHEGCTEKTEVTVIPMLEHTYGEWEVVTAPTCTEKGKEKHTCTVCGHFEERDIDALGHDYEWTVTTAPTETEEGEETEICQHDNSHTRGTRTLHATGTAGLQFEINSEGTEYTLYNYTGTATVIYIPSFYNNKPVTAIGATVFYYMINITEVHMKEGIKVIGDSTFTGCRSLASITIPNSVSNIGTGIFYGCNNLSEITLPFIGASASSPAKMDYLFISSSMAEVKKVNVTNALYIGNYAFESCTGLTNITLNDGILSIGNNAFYGCSALNNIIIPDSVTSIGNYAFVSCSTFSEIIIPNSVTAIGDYAFSMCSNLNSITMGNNVQSIGNYAFKDLAALQSIVIPFSVTTLGAELFYNSAITMIYCEASSKPAGWSAQWNFKSGSYIPVTWMSDGTMREYSFETNGGSAVDPITAYNVQSAPITQIEGYMVYGWYDNAELSGEPVIFPYFSKTELTLYARWESQCTYIFYDEDGITELKKETVCYGCAINAPENPTKAATAQYTYTFEGWDKEIPETITGNIVFTAVYSQKVNQYTLTFSSNGGSAVVAITQDYGTAVSRPADPEKPGYIFEGWYTDNVIFALPYEFATVTENITLYAKWSEHPGTEGLVYALIYGEYYVSGYNGTATEVVVPLKYNGIKVVSLANAAFNNKGIASIVISGNVTSMGNDTFAGCTYLNKIIIPNSVTQIGSGAFSGCTSLNEILIPSGVTWIGENAFYGCIGLTKVIIPDSLVQINRGLFYNCSSLNEVVIGSGIKTINEMAFGGCSGLSKVYYKGTAEQFALLNVVPSQNTYFTAAAKYYYSQTPPTEGGNYWHYDTDGKTPIIWYA